MKHVLCAAILLLLPYGAAGQAAGTRLTDLSWLAGCWETRIESRGLIISEMWMKPEGEAMIGVGRTIRNGKLADYEFLRIVQDAAGLSYISRPSANKEDTAFKLARSSATELVFENPAHDFPQRIIYRRNGDKLNARIEGTSNGRTRGVDFAYSRVKCE